MLITIHIYIYICIYIYIYMCVCVCIILWGRIISQLVFGPSQRPPGFLDSALYRCSTCLAHVAATFAPPRVGAIVAIHPTKSSSL